MNHAWRAGAGGGMLHPIPVVAIILLVANDHWLKWAYANAITGKLSDVAGLVFFPLFLVAAFEVVTAGAGRYRGPSDRSLLLAIAATGIVFALVQLCPAATECYRLALAALQRPVEVTRLILAGVPLEALPRVYATADRTDLFALPALLLPTLIGRAASRGHTSCRRRSRRPVPDATS